MLKLAIGVLIGGALGSLMGYYGKCTSGACPLTSTPWRGAIYGAVMGGLLSSLVGGYGGAEKVDPAIQEAGRSEVVHVTDGVDFQENVLDATQPVLVDMYSDRCPPCRALAPVIDKLAYEFRGKATVAKLDVDALPQIAERYEVRAIPTVLIMKDGKVVQRLVGLKSSDVYADALNALTEPDRT